jgi:O-antigen/teichoic acid export membrane protein
VNGFAAYGFLVISARMLGPAAYAPLSILWTLVFLAGPGLFMPLEQELGRRLASRPAEDAGGDLVFRIGIAGGVLALALVALSGAASSPILEHLLGNQALLLAGLLISIVGYCVLYLVRGILSGTGEFGRYGLLMGAEGVIRVLACGGLAMFGARTAGPYGLLVGLTPLLAVALTWPRRLTRAGRAGGTMGWRALSAALAHLLTGQMLAQLLVNAAPLAVALLATRTQQDVAGRFLACLVLARVPLFLFQAVQAALLPKLAALVHQGRGMDFRTALRRLTSGVAAVIALVSAGAFLVGPEMVRFFFGPEFDLGRRDLLYLAAGSGIYMIAIVYAQALIALGAHSRVAVGWLAGLVGFIAATAAGSDLLLRVETGLLTGATVAAGVMAAIALERMRVRIPVVVTVPAPEAVRS